MKIEDAHIQAQYDNFERKSTLWMGYKISLELASMGIGGVIGHFTYERVTFPFAICLSLIAGFSVRALLEMPKKYWSECLRSELQTLQETDNKDLKKQLKRCADRICAAESLSRTLGNCFLLTALVASVVLCTYEE